MVATIDTIMKHNPQVVSQVLPNEAVLLVPQRGEVKVLNDVGARIWVLLDGQRTVGQIAAVICAEYAVDQIQAEHDTLHFVQDLFGRDLLVVGEVAS